MNAPQNRRMQFRAILHCAPLVLENRTAPYNLTEDGVNIPFKGYYYGPTIEGPEILWNYTYMSPIIGKAQVALDGGGAEKARYTIGYASSYLLVYHTF